MRGAPVVESRRTALTFTSGTNGRWVFAEKNNRGLEMRESVVGRRGQKTRVGPRLQTRVCTGEPLHKSCSSSQQICT